MHVCHSSGNISSKGKSKPPVQRNVFVLQHIIETTFGAVLADQGNAICLIEGSSNELAQVWMIQCPAVVTAMSVSDTQNVEDYLICMTSFLTVLLTTSSFLGTFFMATIRPPLHIKLNTEHCQASVCKSNSLYSCLREQLLSLHRCDGI